MNGIMKLIAALGVAALARGAEVEPKVTQAAFCDFGKNRVSVRAVEYPGKPFKLMCTGKDKGSGFSAAFYTEANDEFSYVNPYLRFREFKVKGLPSPVIVAVAACPGYSDESYEVKIIGEKAGRVAELADNPIRKLAISIAHQLTFKARASPNVSGRSKQPVMGT